MGRICIARTPIPSSIVVLNIIVLIEMNHKYEQVLRFLALL